MVTTKLVLTADVKVVDDAVSLPAADVKSLTVTLVLTRIEETTAHEDRTHLHFRMCQPELSLVANIGARNLTH